jgi:hypothetical protein
MVAKVFSERLKQLRANAGGQAAAVRGEKARPWQVPDNMKDLLDVPNLHKAGFDRQEINDAYQTCMQDTENFGTVGDIIALKQQVDYVATEERAFRLRHATICRCLIHGAARRFGQSVSRTYPNIEQQVSDIIAAGGA